MEPGFGSRRAHSILLLGLWGGVWERPCERLEMPCIENDGSDVTTGGWLSQRSVDDVADDALNASVVLGTGCMGAFDVVTHVRFG